MNKNGPKLIAILVIMALVAMPVAGAKGKKRKKRPKPAPIVRVERQVPADYARPSGVRLQDVDATSCVNAVQGENCLSFTGAVGERYVTIEVTDTSGQPAPIKVFVDGGDASHHCGSIEEPLTIDELATLNVQIMAVALPDCQAVGTTGTVTATFSNLP